MNASVPFVDLATQQARLRTSIEQRLGTVLNHGQYISGPEVDELEARLSERAAGAEVVTCSSGTDALVLSLMALGIEQGDLVLVPAFTFVATAEAVVLAGGSPVFVDVDPNTFLVTSSTVNDALSSLRSLGAPRPIGLITVDLFGHPVETDTLVSELIGFDGWVLSDAAQSFGASIGTRPVGTFGVATCTSFFPSKPLGAYGDGGAIFTDDPALADDLRMLRSHGQSEGTFQRIGMTGRLDSMQAAVLLAKLTVFDEEIDLRAQVAERYVPLSHVCTVPIVAARTSPTWAQYTIKSGERDLIERSLTLRGIPTAVHYRQPVSAHPAYSRFALLDTPSSDHIASQVLSLPMHPYLEPEVQSIIINAVLTSLSNTGSPDPGVGHAAV